MRAARGLRALGDQESRTHGPSWFHQGKPLVAYLLSIDEARATFAIPGKGGKGAKGGNLCFCP